MHKIRTRHKAIVRTALDESMCVASRLAAAFDEAAQVLAPDLAAMDEQALRAMSRAAKADADNAALPDAHRLRRFVQHLLVEGKLKRRRAARSYHDKEKVRSTSVDATTLEEINGPQGKL